MIANELIFADFSAFIFSTFIYFLHMDDSTIVEKIIKPMLARRTGIPSPREYWKKVMNASLLFEILLKAVICGGIWFLTLKCSQELANCVLFGLLLLSIKSKAELENSHVLDLIYQELDKNTCDQEKSIASSEDESNGDPLEKDI